MGKYGQDACNGGDEGGFAPSVQDNNEALDVLMDAIKQSGHEAKIKFATDVAASEFWIDGKYDLDFKNPQSPPEMKMTADQLSAYYQTWMDKYPLVSSSHPQFLGEVYPVPPLSARCCCVVVARLLRG